MTAPSPVLFDAGYAADLYFRVPREQEAERIELRLHLRDVLNDWRSAVGLDEAPPFEFPPEPVEPKPLIPPAIGEFADGDYSSVPLPVQDTVWLQQSVQFEGTLDDAGPPLFRLPPSTALEHDSKPQSLGSSQRYWAECEPGADPSDCRRAAETLAAAVFPGDGFQFFTTARGALGLRVADRRAAAVLVYPRYEESDPRLDEVSTDLQFRIPFLILCRLKLENIAQSLRKSDLSVARERDRKLIAFLDEYRKVSTGIDEGPKRDRRTLPALQTRVDRVSDLIEELSESVSLLERRLRSVAVNRSLVRQLLREGMFAPEASAGLPEAERREIASDRRRLRRMLAEEPGERLKDVLEADLGYKRGTLRRAQVHWERIEATVDLQEADRESKLAKVMAFVGFAASFSVIKDLLDGDGVPNSGATAPGWMAWAYQNWSLTGRSALLLALFALFVVIWKIWIDRPPHSEK